MTADQHTASIDPKKKQRSLRRRIRNSLTVAISLALILLYTVDLGFDRRSDNFARTQSALNEQKDLLRAAEKIHIVFYDEAGHKHLSVHSDSATFGAIHAMNIPAPLRENIQLNSFGFNGLDDDSLEDNSDPTAGMNHLLLNPVTVTSFQELESSATVRADFAFMNALEQEIHLAGKVTAHNIRENSRLTTNSLSMNTESRHIFGNQPVNLVFKNAQTTAVGIDGSQLDGRWQLLSKVKTILSFDSSQ